MRNTNETEGQLFAQRALSIATQHPFEIPSNMMSVAASPAPEVPPTSYDGLGESLDEEIA